MKGAIVTIGEGTGISNTLIYCHQRIDIKENVFIGGSVQIFDTDFHSIGYEDRLLNGDNTVKCAPVLIKKGAFIGTSSIILKGVTIGAKSIVAAGSVVSKSIPDGEIWGGNPAKYIRDL
jgi:acetyltransferase-like isoleucine patch superfamily enzyme